MGWKMKTCPECNHKMKEDRTVCPNCGAIQLPYDVKEANARERSREYCRGCIYDQRVSGDHCCNYINEVGVRPCPAGDGCTVRKYGKKKKYELENIGNRWVRK